MTGRWAIGLAMIVCAGGTVPAEARTLDAVWTAAAERAYVNRQAKGVAGQLPEVRAYDAEGRLVMRLLPAGQDTVGALLAALTVPRPIAGPSLSEALSALQLRGGGAVAPATQGARLVVIDYWASWCAPCKTVSAELDRFMAGRPEGVVLVRAETDFVAAQRRAQAE